MFWKQSRCLCAVFWLLGLPWLAWAAPTQSDIDKAIRELGDDSFQVREKASAWLWSAGRAAEPALRRAVLSDDNEVAGRARKLLDQFKHGIYPDTPKKVVELVNQYRNATPNARLDVIHKLAAEGSKGCVAVTKLVAAEDKAANRSILCGTILDQAPEVAVGLLLADELDALEEMLSASLSEAVLPHYAALVLVRGRLDEKLAHYQARAEQSGEVHKIVAYLCRAKGDLAGARRAAEKSKDERLLAAILYEQADWKTLAGWKGEAFGDNLETQAAYHRLAGNQEAFETAITALHATEASGGDRLWLAHMLFLNRKPKQALETLQKGQHSGAMFEILVAQLRYREAFALATKASVPPERGAKADAGMNWSLIEAQGRALHSLGEKEQVEKLFAKLGEECAADPAHLSRLIGIEIKIGLREQAFVHFARLFRTIDKREPSREDEPRQETQGHFLHEIFPDNYQAAQVCWKFLRQGEPRPEVPAALGKIDKLLTGRKTRAELQALAEKATAILPALEPDHRKSWHFFLARQAQEAGLDDLARHHWEKAIEESASAEALLHLADFLAEKKMWREAADRYDQAWEKDRTAVIPLYLRGWALTQSGQIAEGKKLMALAHTLPLGNVGLRYALAVALKNHGLRDEARQEWTWILRLGAFHSWHGLVAQETLAREALARQDFLQAAELSEIVAHYLMRRDVFYPETYYLIMPSRIEGYRARGLLAAGKIDDALRHIRLCREIFPADVDATIPLIVALDKLGRTQEADALFEECFKLFGALCADYPRSAWGHNHRSWLAARCRRRLDLALDHARKAVALAPDSAGYLDTLAEVHFQRGDKQQALELMKRCLVLDPKKNYFRLQLRRIEAGDPAVDVPIE